MDPLETDPARTQDTVEQLDEQELRNPLTDDDAALVTPGEGFPSGEDADPSEESEGPPNSPKAFPPM